MQYIGSAGGCLVVVDQCHSTGCTSQVSLGSISGVYGPGVNGPGVTAGLFTFFYFRFMTSKILDFQCEGKMIQAPV